ncbi:hypothetical protein PF005_g27086 [Phytophthora fragariae]|uniref:RxLR effector protein n=1 Tax=Phytophthora fragariae TaxID=53985 RepID=A0A6A4BN30_9STRA|nr:hypothetical protein PF003_g19334 [Phytophthora fragariae]KAE9068363.1 hypothetical protein PF007_g27718 [Phytophthora fragariae]KAE9171573.1 hypothetical protein PF005_g27086 [Phytophthora fragariae]KAE9275667.1 hypothetical protein PF001_g26479 [Phytophthora fragariae]
MPRNWGFLLIACASVSIARLNKSGASGQACRIPDLIAQSWDVISLTRKRAVVPSCSKSITLIN